MNSLTPSLSRFMTLLFCVLPLSACAVSGSGIEGQVVEQGTNNPISGAIVIARWHGTASLLVDSQTVCVHVESTVTDDQGRFHFSRWYQPPRRLVSGVQPTATAYKPGYEGKLFEEKIYHLKPFTGGRGERLRYLRRMSGAIGCGSSGESEKNLYLLRKAIYEEAKQIARTDFEKYVAAGFEHSANRLLLPPDKRISLPYPHREKSELLEAVEDNNVSRAKTLLAGGADPNDRTDDGSTMLMIAIRYGFSEMAILLLENGADPNAKTFDDQDMTAMALLIYRNRESAIAMAGKIVAMMIEKGYNVNHRDVSGKTALEQATQYRAEKNAEIITVLRKHLAGSK